MVALKLGELKLYRNPSAVLVTQWNLLKNVSDSTTDYVLRVD